MLQASDTAVMKVLNMFAGCQCRKWTWISCDSLELLSLTLSFNSYLSLKNINTKLYKSLPSPSLDLWLITDEILLWIFYIFYIFKIIHLTPLDKLLSVHEKCHENTWYWGTAYLSGNKWDKMDHNYSCCDSQMVSYLGRGQQPARLKNHRRGIIRKST